MVKGDAVFSPCGRYRYLLSRQWQDGDVATCVWWMINPSYADAVKSDLTVTKTIGFAQRWGFGRNILVNMFALVSTDPKVMVSDHDPIGPETDTYLWGILNGQLDTTPLRVDRIVCAWGNIPSSNDALWRRVDSWARRLKDDRRTVCLGRTKNGEPRHPSRLSYDTPVEPFGVRMRDPPTVVGAGGVVGW